MDLVVRQTGHLVGTVTPPSSKSQNIRALFFALMASGKSVLTPVLESDDMQDAIRVCQTLGASLTRHGSEIRIDSPGLPLQGAAQSLNCGNSGITTRFALPLMGYRQNPEPIVFDCGPQMRARPIRTLVEALQHLGLDIRYLAQWGACPLRVHGHLRGGKTHVDGLSSQYLSALLMSLPCAELDSEISVTDLHERPYVEMTLNWLREQHIQFQHHTSVREDIYYITGGQRYRPFHKILTGDFSSASCLIGAGALLGNPVELRGLDMADAQGDKRLIKILQEMGADITIEASRLIIYGGKPLTGIRIDANDIPDLLPILAVIGAHAAGKTTLTHVAQARIKETDRIYSMTEGLTRMGAKIEEHADGLRIFQSTLKGSHLQGFADHRTVMALSVAGLTASGVTTIDDAQSIDKTFPNFIEAMQTLGADMEKRDGF